MIFERFMKVAVLSVENKDKSLTCKDPGLDFSGEFYIQWLVMDRPVLLLRKGNTGKTLQTSDLKGFGIEDSILRMETENSIYRMEILEKGIVDSDQ